jgi:hypothetical protein
MSKATLDDVLTQLSQLRLAILAGKAKGEEHYFDWSVHFKVDQLAAWRSASERLDAAWRNVGEASDILATIE